MFRYLVARLGRDPGPQRAIATVDDYLDARVRKACPICGFGTVWRCWARLDVCGLCFGQLGHAADALPLARKRAATELANAPAKRQRAITNPPEEKKCHHCSSTQTAKWRRDGERKRICNPCAMKRRVRGKNKQ